MGQQKRLLNKTKRVKNEYTEERDEETLRSSKWKDRVRCFEEIEKIKFKRENKIITNERRIENIAKIKQTKKMKIEKKNSLTTNSKKGIEDK